MQGLGKGVIMQVAYHHESVVMLWDELFHAVRDIESVVVGYY